MDSFIQDSETCDAAIGQHTGTRHEPALRWMIHPADDGGLGLDIQLCLQNAVFP